MGKVLIPNNESHEIEEVQGTITLSQLYQDLRCESYTVIYRQSVMTALGKIGKQAWGALAHLRDITQGSNSQLAESAVQAISKIDPGNPIKVTKKESKENKHPDGCSCLDCKPKEKPKIKTEVQKVTITAVPGDLTDGVRLLGQCNFCGKVTMFHRSLRKCNERLCGPHKLYCNFCIRNDFYQRYAKNIMVITFRGVIGYYYYCFTHGKNWSMTGHDLQDIINLHYKLGIQNPLFRYDHDSFCWFIDFSKVGSSKKKMPVESVLETVVQMLAAFNFYEHTKDVSPAKLYTKYKEAILDFHHHRRRPAEQRILAPTLYGCGLPYDNINSNRFIASDVLKNFTPDLLQEGACHTTRGKFRNTL